MCFNKSGFVMHVLWCGIKAHLILKCLKNGIESSVVVSGKMQLSEWKRNGKACSNQNKTALVVSGEGERGILVLFWVRFYRSIVFCVETHRDSGLVNSEREKEYCLLKIGLMLKCEQRKSGSLNAVNAYQHEQYILHLRIFHFKCVSLWVDAWS